MGWELHIQRPRPRLPEQGGEVEPNRFSLFFLGFLDKFGFDGRDDL
jgi:hypothetical protein